MKTAIILNMLLGIHITTRMLTSSARLSSSAAKAAQSTKRVVVIGGGAAGYFSAIECAKLLSESQRKSDGSPSVRYEVYLSFIESCRPYMKFSVTSASEGDFNQSRLCSQVIVLEAGQKPLTKVLISGLHFLLL